MQVKLLELLAKADVTVDVDNIPKVNANAASVGAILSGVFTLIGGLAVLFLLIGAVRYVTSNGDQSQLSLAKNTIVYAVVGIVISLSAFAIVQFVIGQLA